MALLASAGGCMRASDGSIEMRRASRGKLFSFREEEPARIVPSRSLPRQATLPLPTSLDVARPAPSPPEVTVPAIQIAKNPPFRNVDPSKPLSCSNEKTASGRIRVVCT
jgi:hypothetical protein